MNDTEKLRILADWIGSDTPDMPGRLSLVLQTESGRKMVVNDLRHIATEFAHHDIEIERLRESLAEIREVWAGSECGQPVYAQEAYAIRLCKQQYKIACEALEAIE